MKKLDIAGHSYAVGKMPVLNQFHVARRLGPVLAVMGITAAHLSGAAEIDIKGFVPVLGPMAQVLASMTDEDANYVISECLATVSREVQGRNAPITTPVAADHQPRMMFEDIDMPVMLRLVWAAVQENLGGFMQGLGDEPPSTGS